MWINSELQLKVKKLNRVLPSYRIATIPKEEKPFVEFLLFFYLLPLGAVTVDCALLPYTKTSSCVTSTSCFSSFTTSCRGKLLFYLIFFTQQPEEGSFSPLTAHCFLFINVVLQNRHQYTSSTFLGHPLTALPNPLPFLID